MHIGDGRERPGIGHSVRPGTQVPATVLISDMGSGGLYLEGWRIGPSAYLTAEDAAGLKDLTLIKLLILLMCGRLTCGFAVRVG